MAVQIREALTAPESLFEGNNKQLLCIGWTEWIAIMKSLEGNGWELRADGNGYQPAGDFAAYMKRTCAIIDGCGIYELRMVTALQSIVVYVGSSCSGDGGGVVKRLCSYVNYGSHIPVYINTALKNGATIEARCKYAPDREESGRLENELLRKYDYLWNKRNNWTKRKMEALAKVFVTDKLLPN